MRLPSYVTAAIRKRNPHLFGAGSAAPSDACESEAELHNDILKYCKARGWLVFHGSMAHKTHRFLGEPDCVILMDGGKVLLVECKSKTGKLTPEQVGVAVWAERLGHKVHLVRSMSDFRRIVDENC